MPSADFVLLRGLAREGRHWGGFVTQLENQKFCTSVTCIDFPGFGKFNQLQSPMTIEAIADFVATQLESHSSKKRVLLAVSLGAMVGAELVSQHDDLFSKVFLMNTSFSNLSPLYHRMQLSALGRFFQAARAGRDVHKREEEILKMVSNSPEKIKKIKKDWAEIFLTRPSKLASIFRQLVAASRYKLPDTAPQTPIVLFNSKGDNMVHPSCSEALSKHWNLKLYTHSWSGHDLCIDDPDWVIEQIKKEL